jgi:Uma2 family endonuclease
METSMETSMEKSTDTLLPHDLFPDVRDIITEDDEPVDNIFSEKQQRLLTEALHASWNGNGRPFFTAANVGVFYALYEPPVVPDVFVSMDVQPREEWANKDRKTYFCWEFGKSPELAVEIVSNRKGGELERKFKDYARVGVWYYIVFDPLGALKREMGGETLRLYELRRGGYSPMNDFWMEGVGLGLRLWEGEYEGWQGVWLRWCDERGNLLPTGRELSEQEKARAETEKARAETEKARAETEKARADSAEEKLEQLTAKLRALGIEPDAD